MQKVALGLGIVSLSLASCSLPEDVHGFVDACIAVETLPTDSGALIEDPYNVTLTRTGLRTVAADEHLAAPEEFHECANEAQLEFVEADGRHVWLSLAAALNDESVLPADLLSTLQNGTLEFQRVEEVLENLTISDDNGMVVTLHGGAVGGAAGIDVVAESAGPTVPADCGWASAQRLRFNDSLVLDSGGTGTLELGTSSATVVNIHSGSYTNDDNLCTDGGSGVFAVWAAYRNESTGAE